MAGLEGDLTTAQTHLEKSLTLARWADDTCGVATALRAIGSALFQQGQVAACIAPLSEAIALTRQLGDQRQTAFLLAYLATAVAHQGEFGRAEALVTESQELFRALGDSGSFEANLLLLAEGLIALMEGDLDRAGDRLSASLRLGKTLDAKAIVAATLGGLGQIAVARGKDTVAAGHFGEGLIEGWDGEYPLGIAWNLIGLMQLACRHGRLTSAARIVGGLDGVARLMQALPPAAIAAYEADVAGVQTSLGYQSFTTAREAGRELPLEEAVTEAVALADELLSGTK